MSLRLVLCQRGRAEYSQGDTVPTFEVVAVTLSFGLAYCLSRMDRSSTAIYVVNARLAAYPEV